MSDEGAVRDALRELSTAAYPRICRCMHAIAGAGAWLTAADIMTMLEALLAHEARVALGGDGFPDLKPLLRSVAGIRTIRDDVPESLRTAFAVQLAEAGVISASELGGAIVEQAAADFLNDGSVPLSTFAGTDLLDRIARGVTPERFTYHRSFEPYFAICSPAQASQVIRGYANPEQLTDLVAASELDNGWLAELAASLAEQASTAQEWRSVLCALGALVARGASLSAQQARVLDRALPHARDKKRADRLLLALPAEHRSTLVRQHFEWGLVRSPLDDAALARVARELLAGNVTDPYCEGAFGARAVDALLRLSDADLGRLEPLVPELSHSQPGGLLLEEARHHLAATPRRGALARERDRAFTALFTDEPGVGETWVQLWEALWPDALWIVPPEQLEHLAAFGVERPPPGHWLAVPRNHPLCPALASKDAYERVVAMNGPRLMCTFYEASLTAAERTLAAFPRRAEVLYLPTLPPGYRRTLELVRLTVARLSSTPGLPDEAVARIGARIDEARVGGPRAVWPEPEESLEECADVDRLVILELERLVEELGRYGSRDQQSCEVELSVAYASLKAVEREDPVGRRALARAWFEAWLDEDVVTAATLVAG